MNISDFATYKVIECDQLLAIVAADQKIAQREAIELIISNMRTCCEYLARYTYERSGGADPDTAHRSALKGAKVIQAGGRDTAQLQS